MKRYKVTCIETKDSEPWGNYLDILGDAEKFAQNYKGFSAKISVVEVERHHSAKMRGYWARGCPERTPYKGKFGEGYIRHHYNADHRDCYHYSNNYHIITYFIEVI